jgi:hypothetical protein
MPSATSHKPKRALSSTSPPAIQNAPAAESQMRTSAARSRSIVPDLADANVRKALRPTWMTTYEAANSRPFDPNASGMATAITSVASMIPSSSRRTTGESGSSSFVTHVV